jgi:hypothetical protein
MRFALGQASVAFTVSDGAVGLVEVVQSLQTHGDVSDFGMNYTLECSFDIAPKVLFEADKRATSGMAWVNPPGRSVR